MPLVKTLNAFQTQSPGCHYDNVDYTFAIPYLDVTSEFVTRSGKEFASRDDGKQSPKSFDQRSLPKSIKKRGSHEEQLKPFSHNASMKNNSSLNFTKPSEELQRPKRQEDYFEYSAPHPLHSPSQTDTESFAYFFPEDYFEGIRIKLPLGWPTPNGLTSAKAQEICHRILANSTIGLVCKVLLGKLIDEAINICMLDLQLKDDVAWVRALIALLENECERRVLRNRGKVFRVGSQPSATQEEILTILRCPAFCNGNGQCTDLGCQCFEDHSSYDCSTANSK